MAVESSLVVSLRLLTSWYEDRHTTGLSFGDRNVVLLPEVVLSYLLAEPDAGVSMTSNPYDQSTPSALITIGEAAQLLDVSIRHMQRLTASGHFHAVKLGRSVRYRRHDPQWTPQIRPLIDTAKPATTPAS